MDFEIVRMAVRNCSLFRGFEEEQLGYLMMNLEVQEFKEGQTIYRKGDEAGTTFLLLIGGEAGLVGDSGKILEVIGTCQIIGEIGVVSPKQRRTATIVSLKPTVALKWDYGNIKERLPELDRRLKDLAWKHASKW
jgi:CRP-like cAMP-binding protein